MLQNNYFTEMCSGSEAGSYLRLIDCVYHSALGLRVIKKRRRRDSRVRGSDGEERRRARTKRERVRGVVERGSEDQRAESTLYSVTPYTLHPTPPYILHLKPPYILYPTPPYMDSGVHSSDGEECRSARSESKRVGGVVGGGEERGCRPPYILHLTPYTLHPTPYTIHPPTPYTLHPAPCTLHSTPYTLSLQT